MILVVIVLSMLLSNIVFAETLPTSCKKEGYTVSTINGIFTDEEGARNNQRFLRILLKDEYKGEKIDYQYLLNPTHLAGVGDLLDAVAQGLFDQESDYDLIEMLNDASQKVTTQKLLLVGHSQGNFYANNFYDKAASQPGGVPSQSIGVYSVGTPANLVAGGGKYLTSDTDNVIASVVARFINILSPNVHIPLQNDGSDGNGHSFSDVYLKYQGDKIISDIKFSLNKLQNNDEQLPQDPCISPPELTVFHNIQGVAFTSADFVINNTNKAGVYIADSAYNSGAIIGSVIHNTALTIDNIVSGLLANAVDSLPDVSSVTTILPDISSDISKPTDIKHTEATPPYMQEKTLSTTTVESTPESNKKENVVNNVLEPIIPITPIVPNIVFNGGGGGGGGGGGSPPPVADTTAPVITILGTDPVNIVVPPPPPLATFTIDKDTTLTAGEYNYDNLIITNNATLTLEGDSQSSNSFKGVKITAVNLTITKGASISADQKGYGPDQGPGVVEALSGVSNPGASYGGLSYNNPNGVTYGSEIEPIHLGSGGAGLNHGGGAIRIVVSDTFTNDGIISSNGGDSSSGGSIYVTANNIVGSGIFRANGGRLYQAGHFKSPGGGGRVALYYQTSSFSGIIEAKGGCGDYGNGGICAQNGTAGVFDTLNNDLYLNGYAWQFLQKDGPFSFNNIFITNSIKVISENNVSITANKILINNSASFTLGDNNILNVLTIALDGSSILTFSGSEIMTTNILNINGNSTVTVTPEHTLTLNIPNIIVSVGSYLSVNGAGYLKGLGASLVDYDTANGASYGGLGGGTSPSQTYGSATTPIDFGSGTMSYRGGGALRLIVENLENNGTISADGALGQTSGGSIYATINHLSGNGSFSANGGGVSWFYGAIGGSGGRIAIYYQDSSFSGTAIARGGLYCFYDCVTAAGDGTVGLFDVPKNTLNIYKSWRFQKNDSLLNFNHIVLTNGAMVITEDGVNITADDLLLDKISTLTLAKDLILNIPSITLDGSSTLILSGSETMTTNILMLTGNSIVTVLPENILSLNIPNISIASGSSISADGKGYMNGPGSPDIYYEAGASYGGKGGGVLAKPVYGSAKEPVDFGSGTEGSRGGGAVHLIVDNILQNDGMVSANGNRERMSGGSIYVTANKINGNGIFQANGGNSSWPYGAIGGSGGRIAIYYKDYSFSGTVTALAGKYCFYDCAPAAEDGTLKIIDSKIPIAP